MCSTLPIEVWLAIARAAGAEADEYVFNILARTVPRLGRWSVTGTDGEIISRRLDLMCVFGYDVRIGQPCPKIRFKPAHEGLIRYLTYESVYYHVSYGKFNDAMVWYKNGLIHRNDGPAVEHDDIVGYYKHEVPHRVDGPAIKCLNARSERWWMNGKLHRIGGGPAVIEGDSYVQWWRDGLLHRRNGPANVCDDVREWYQHGLLHCPNGPALVCDDGLEW